MFEQFHHPRFYRNMQKNAGALRALAFRDRILYVLDVTQNLALRYGMFNSHPVVYQSVPETCTALELLMTKAFPIVVVK